MTRPVLANVRAEIARRDLNQAEIARRLGMTQQAFSRRLRGQTPLSVDDLVRIAELLDVPAAALLEVAS